eukprot:RCo042287
MGSLLLPSPSSKSTAGTNTSTMGRETFLLLADTRIQSFPRWAACHHTQPSGAAPAVSKSNAHTTPELPASRLQWRGKGHCRRTGGAGAASKCHSTSPQSHSHGQLQPELQL